MEQAIRLERVQRLGQTLRKRFDPTSHQFRFAEVIVIEVMRLARIELAFETVESRSDDRGRGQVRIALESISRNSNLP